MFRRPRHRVRLSLLLLVGMLFQYVAVSAYACASIPAVPARMPAGMEHCVEMAKPAMSTPAPALCEKHCSPDQTLTTDASALHVPALLHVRVFSLVLQAPEMQPAARAEVPISRSDPPPRLLYCSFLI